VVHRAHSLHLGKVGLADHLTQVISLNRQALAPVFADESIDFERVIGAVEIGYPASTYRLKLLHETKDTVEFIVLAFEVKIHHLLDE